MRTIINRIFHQNTLSNPNLSIITVSGKDSKRKIAYTLKIAVLFCLFIIATAYERPVSTTLQGSNEYYLQVFQDQLKNYFSEKITFQPTSTMHSNTSNLVEEFYRMSDYSPWWTINFMPSPMAEELMSLFENSHSYGLNPEFYNVKKINAIKNALSESGNQKIKFQLRQQLELEYTQSALNFILHLSKGLAPVDSSAEYNYFVSSLPRLLNDAVQSDLKIKILDVQPKSNDYVWLQKAWEKYLDQTELSESEFLIIKPGKDLPAKDNTIRKRLTDLGYLNRIDSENDSIFSIALRNFQRFHGITPDGELNSKTQIALAQSAWQKFQQVAVNLERLRKENHFSEFLIDVNIPAYKLKVIRNNKIQNTFNVIVGNPKTPTPEVYSKIEKIVTNPYWNVPKSITINELIPKIKHDSTYLSRNRFKIIDRERNIIDEKSIDWTTINARDFKYFFRQDASRSNALGLIKFLFPNPYSVYLHDTPGKQLFSKDLRAFSHGCIRLQDPDKLAKYLLDYDNSNHSVNNLLKAGENTEIKLQEDVDIRIRYLTCEADEDLNIYFYNDIYNKDLPVIEKWFN